jgi:hypothetical protein
MRTQLRGHCQACGRLQAVRSGQVALHGYEVQDGFFNGTCAGSRHAPVEVEKTFTETVIKGCLEQAAQKDEVYKQIETGERNPVSGRNLRCQMVSWDELSPAEQTHARTATLYKLKQAAKFFNDHAKFLTELIAECHEKELTTVSVQAPPPEIFNGEKRLNAKGKVLVVTGTSSGKVSWKDERGFIGSCSTRMWRTFAIME